MPLTASIDAYVYAHRFTQNSRDSAFGHLNRYLRAAGPDLGGTMEWWQMLSKSVSPSTLRTTHSVVHGYCKWLVAQGLIDASPLEGIRPPRAVRPNPVTLTPEEVQSLRDACSNPRDALMVELAWGLGLRCVEISRLEVADVDLVAGFVDVHGKGNTHETMPIPPSVARSIRLYLSRHPASSGPLVRDLRFHRRGLLPKTVSIIMANLAKDAGVKTRAYDGKGAHSLRRTCATDLLERGANPSQVMRVLRHSSLRSIDHYLRRVNSEELRPLLDARAG